MEDVRLLATEDRWTPPSSWCPNPQWWHSDAADPDGAEQEVTGLVTALVRACQPEVVVETGTAAGQTAYAIGWALKDNGHGRLYTIEIDREAASAAEARLNGLPVIVACKDSLDWWPQYPIDFAWIDSGTAQTRVREIDRWASMFSPGALIGVHDTAPNQGREVLRSLASGLFGSFGWPVLSLRTPRGVMIAQVPC